MGEVIEFGDDVEKMVKMIVEFFDGYKCDIGVKDLKKIVDDIKNVVGLNFLKFMYDKVMGFLNRYFKNMDDLVC